VARRFLRQRRRCAEITATIQCVRRAHRPSSAPARGSEHQLHLDTAPDARRRKSVVVEKYAAKRIFSRLAIGLKISPDGVRRRPEDAAGEQDVGGGSMRPRGQCSTTSSNVACGGPNSSSSMARPGLENAIAAVWSGVPVQRCTVGVVEEVSYSSLDAAISPSPSRDCRQANGEARGSPRDQMPPKGSIRISPPLDKRASGLPRSSPS